jgi:fumarate hydratase class II
VIGNDTSITIGCQAGNFELNVMMPLIAHNLLQAIQLLSSAADILARKCVQDISANEKRCRAYVEQSLALCTSLAPVIGYEKAAAIAKEAFRTGETVREVAKRKNVLSDTQLNTILDPEKMIK